MYKSFICVSERSTIEQKTLKSIFSMFWFFCTLRFQIFK